MLVMVARLIEQFQIELVLMSLGLLDAENVRISGFQPVQESFFDCSPYSIDIVRDDFHSYWFLS